MRFASVWWTVEGIVFPIATDVNTLESDNVVQVLTHFCCYAGEQQST